MFQSFLDFLGSPALVKELRLEVDYLKERLRDLENERLKLQDSFLMKNGSQPLYPPDLPPATQQSVQVPYDDWKRQDIQNEVQGLIQLAQEDPETYEPLLEEALIRYKDDLK